MLDRLIFDWPLKLLALLLAFGIWLAITGQDKTIRDLSVPLEFEFGEELIADAPPPTAVTVRLEGPRSAMRNLDLLRLAVRVELDDALPGEQEVPLLRSQLAGVPQGVVVSLIDPDRVRISVARRARRELEIVPDLMGEPADGYTLYGFVADPPSVVVEGPERAVHAMSALRTASIPLDGHGETFVAEVGLVPEDPAVRAVGIDDARIEVDVDLAPVERVFDSIAVELPAGSTATLEGSPPSVKVTLSGPPWLLESLDPTRISASVAATDPLQPGGRRPVVVQLELDEKQKRLVRVKSVRPTHVRVSG